jgi:beta-xylosidase
MRRTSTLLISILSTVLPAVVSQQHVLAQCHDNDADGYCSIDSGGDDCGDLMSAYKQTTTGVCRESLDPMFLAAPAIPPPLPQSQPWIHDHSWIRDSNGMYHLFAHGMNASGGSIRHFESPDLTSLRLPVIQAYSIAITSVAGSWDTDGLWAPHVIKHGDTYYMFYTGVVLGPEKTVGKGDDTFKIGLATSQDLYIWTKKADPVFDCTAPWVETTGDNARHCRDPFVMRDDVHNRWLLFATDQLKHRAIPEPGDPPGPVSEGVVVASATDLENGPWTPLGYIKATKTLDAGDGVGAQLTPAVNGVAENPFVTSYNGRYYLFFKDFKDAECETPGNIKTQIQYATSESLNFDAFGSAAWTYRGYTPDPGMSAAEIINHEGDTWLMSAYVANCYADPSLEECLPVVCPDPAHKFELRLKRIVWDGTGGFTTRNLTRLICRVPASSIHPYANDPCNDGVDQDCNPCTSACSGGSHYDPTEF